MDPLKPSQTSCEFVGKTEPKSEQNRTYHDYVKILTDYINENWLLGNIDTRSPENLQKSLNSIQGVDAKIFKRAKDSNDSIILKLDCGINKSFGLKIHPDDFSFCRINYEKHLEKINSLEQTTQVRAVLTINIEDRSDKVVIFDFAEGIPLKEALQTGKIGIIVARDSMLNLWMKLNNFGLDLCAGDESNFIVTDDNRVLLTDWNSICPGLQSYLDHSFESLHASCTRLLRGLHSKT